MDQLNWTEYGVFDSDGELEKVFSTRDGQALTRAMQWYEPSQGDVIKTRFVTQTASDWEDTK